MRGFRRVTLAPGETRRVAFTLAAAHFALWGLKGGWTIEPGTIELMAGTASPASIPIPASDTAIGG